MAQAYIISRGVKAYKEVCIGARGTHREVWINLSDLVNIFQCISPAIDLEQLI